MMEHPKVSVDRRALARASSTCRFASLLLLAAAPILLAAAAYIRLVSPGPVLFRQDRIGRRTSVSNTEVTDHEASSRGGSSTTVRNDPRLIRGGAWLRKYKIDELPQLLNVLSGDMSLVGPRPTVQEDIERMTPVQVQRLLVSPGLTGLAQTRGNTTLNWPERIELDLAYIRSLTLAQDLRIIADTVWQVVSGRADTHPMGDDEWGFPVSLPSAAALGTSPELRLRALRAESRHARHVGPARQRQRAGKSRTVKAVPVIRF